MAVRVVAADGHQIEVGVEFDIAAPAPTTTTEASAPTGPPTSPPVSEVPATTEPTPASTPAPTIEPAIDDPPSADGAADAALEAIDSAGLERWDDLQTGLRPIAYVFTIVLVGAAAFATTAMVFLLSMRLRRSEIDTMTRMGADPGRVAAILGCEILLVLTASLVLAGLLTAMATAWGEELIRWMIF